MEKVKKVLYSCVLLDKKSHSDLLNWYDTYIPYGWKVYAHHMTINMGELSPELKLEIGKTVALRVTEIGLSDRAVAVKVSGFFSKNARPHVTLAINPNNGAKPQHSNDIEAWAILPENEQIQLTGVVTEMEN